MRRTVFPHRLLPILLTAPQLALTAVFFLWPAGQALWSSTTRQDAFGLRTGRMARFVKQYADVHGVLLDAARAYADDVRAGTFPGPEHTF